MTRNSIGMAQRIAVGCGEIRREGDGGGEIGEVSSRLWDGIGGW